MEPGPLSGGTPRVQLVEDRWTVIRHVVEAVAILAAGIWSFYVFVYEERIKPAGQNASMVTTVDAASLGVRHGVEFVRVTVTVKNTGPVDADLDAYALTVTGRRAAAAPAVRHLRAADTVEDLDEIPNGAEHLVYRQVTRLAPAGGTAEDHFEIGRGESGTIRIIVRVPRGRFDTLQAYVSLVYARADATTVAIDQHIDRDGRADLHRRASERAVDESDQTELLLAP